MYYENCIFPSSVFTVTSDKSGAGIPSQETSTSKLETVHGVTVEIRWVDICTSVEVGRGAASQGALAVSTRMAELRHGIFDCHDLGK